MIDITELDGLILIVGETGSGKTSFMNSLIIQQMYNKERYKKSEAVTNMLKNGGFKKLSTPPNHLCYTEGYCRSTMVGHKKFVTYHCDAKKFCLSSKDNKADFYPPYAVLGFDEIQQKFDKRKWGQLKPYYSRAWEVRRHNNYTVYCASQYGNVDSSMRELFNYVILVEDKWLEWSKDKYSHLKSFWKFKLFRSFQSFEQYKFNSDPKLVIAEGIHVYDGDIRKCYDGEEYRAYWFNGRKNSNYTQEENKFVHPNVKDYEKFNESRGVV